jgi:diguanylate cyclase (GGDEF)-like protein
VALALTTLWVIGRLPTPRDSIRLPGLRIGLPLVILVAIAGALSLGAAVPAALWTGAFARHTGRKAGLLAALGIAAGAGLGGMVVHGGGILIPWLLDLSLCIAGAVIAPALRVSPDEQKAPKPKPDVPRERHRRPSSLTGDHPAFSSLKPAHLRRVANSPEAAEADVRALTGFLEDARELLDADDVVLWRWSETAQALQLVALAVRGGRDQMRFPFGEGSALVQRAAQEGRVIDNSEGTAPPRLLAACVDRGDRLYGAVSVYASSGVALNRQAARDRVARLANQMGLLLELLEARHRAETEGARTGTLLRAADEFQRNLDQAALHRAICENAREVTNAVRATFVTWNPDEDCGTVAASTDYERVRPGMSLSDASLVAETCRNRQHTVVDDVPVDARRRIFADQEGRCRIGSLAIVPLVHEHRTVGAVVVEMAQQDAIGSEECATLALLAKVAVPSLEAARKLMLESERAFTDPLTSLANRRAFDERLEHVLNQCDRYNESVSLILADIDHFKRVNDSYGHFAGDEVLRSVAQVIGSSVRTIDLVARYGGEEIAILLPKTGLDGARDLAERLRRQIANTPVEIRGEEVSVTASFGIACYPETSDDRRVLFTNADAALYEAKASGRNQVKSARQHEGSPSFIEMA